jgi:hypothetical protein
MVLLIMRRAGGILLFLTMAWAVVAAGADRTDQAAVVDTDLRAANGWLYADIQLRDVLDMRTASTIDSGLSGVCAYEVTLLGPGDAALGRRTWTLRLEHDLWEDRYLVRSDEGTHDLPSLAAMDSLCSQIQDLRLLPLERLEPDTEYRLSLVMEVLPLAAEDQDRLSHYISRRGSDNREELDLDLGSLFGRLFTGGRAGRTSLAYEGPPFRPRSLEVSR